jgi:hypothetical protein
MHGKMNFFGIKFGWSNFSENTIQCVGISPPKYFLKRPSSFCAIVFQSFSFLVGVTGTVLLYDPKWVEHFKMLAFAR